MAFGWALVGCWPVFVGSGLVFDRLLANRLAEPVTDLSSTGSARAWPRVRPRRPPWRPPRRPPCGPATQQAATASSDQYRSQAGAPYVHQSRSLGWAKGSTGSGSAPPPSALADGRGASPEPVAPEPSPAAPMGDAWGPAWKPVPRRWPWTGVHNSRPVTRWQWPSLRLDPGPSPGLDRGPIPGQSLGQRPHY